jgi:phosphoribosylamine--glycine ligase
MKVLVIGSGGREHVLVWKLKQSPKVDKLYCAPGNAGISEMAECINIDANNIDALSNFAVDNDIDITVVGPEMPLVNGIVDEFKKKGLKCFGPYKDAAVIEASKVFSKRLMKKYNIPTADSREFFNSKNALEYLENAEYPIVIKADGLAAGKGVVIASDYEEAADSVVKMMEDRIFNDAGSRLIIEEFLEGPEVSILAFTDGNTIKPMVSSKDHKRVFDNNMGPNTGGMGTISPNPCYTEDMETRCMKEIYEPTIRAMRMEGRTFKGVIYFGLILTKDGPKVLEYNCRFGDPETQVVLPRLKTDLVDIIISVIDENLEKVQIEWENCASSCVIIASEGYPGVYEKGKTIKGLDTKYDDIMIFHSGTRMCKDGLVTDGGRILGVAATGGTVSEASERIYRMIESIVIDGMYYRKDIGR